MSKDSVGCPENCGCRDGIKRNRDDIKSINNKIWWFVGLAFINMISAIGILVMFILNMMKGISV